MPHPKIKISDNSGNEVGVTSNALDVNIASGSASIAIGDVDLMLDGGVPLLGNAGVVAAGVLRVTLASDDPAVASLDEIESAIENLELCIGVDGDAGPSRCLSIAGTVIGGVIQEIAVDSAGHLQVDVLSAASHAVTNAGTFATQIDGDALTALEKIDDIQDAIGTSGSTGPSKCLSIGGTDGSTLREIVVDSIGRVAVDVQTFAPTATGQAGCMGKVDSESYDTGSIGIMPKVVCSTTLGALTNVGDGEITSMQVNAQGALYTTHGITGGADGITTDDTTGQVLGGDVACKKIDIQALTDNTGLIAVGFTGVDATEATGTGIILYAGDVYSLEINNLNLIYIESTVDTDGVRYTYFT